MNHLLLHIAHFQNAYPHSAALVSGLLKSTVIVILCGAAAALLRGHGARPQLGLAVWNVWIALHGAVAGRPGASSPWGPGTARGPHGGRGQWSGDGGVGAGFHDERIKPSGGGAADEICGVDHYSARGR